MARHQPILDRNPIGNDVQNTTPVGRTNGVRGWIAAVGVLISVATRADDCGGEERWAVKMGADTGAALIDPLSPVGTSMHDLVHLVRPTVPEDDTTRTVPERSVLIVDARLVKFKHETGKTGDSDYHLVISDESLLFSAGGPSSPVSPHSVIAEVVDPECVSGRNGSVVASSRFKAEIESVHQKFEAQFSNVIGGWNDAGGIPVRLTGVVFFDRPHGQVGRALNGLELHPLLDIDFTPGAPATGPPAVVASPAEDSAFKNPSFEQGA